MAPIPGKDMKDTSRCWPIKSLEELLGWTYDWVNPSAIGESISLRRCNPKSSPKTMICHDYNRCYEEDNYIDGLPNVDGFRVDHWAYIDVFVYFSHSFVTIPPVGWINCAHRNGVLMLGTFIVEWEDGSKICNQILETPEIASRVAGLLVAIAEAYNFDGWLMNFEVEVKPEQMDNLMLFLHEVQKGCRAKLGSKSMVVWYDSVKHKIGELAWQNELNGFNVPFFEVCDAIYLNYGWKSANLRASIMNAGTRSITDVYVGIDVFGRGTIGGGGFDSNYALQLLREFGFSVALFAPGWIKETFKDPNHMARSYKFWDLLSPANVCSKVATLPIDTNFCDGYFRNEQSEICFDLNRAQLQPHYCCLREDLPDGCAVSRDTNLAALERKLEQLDNEIKAAAEKLKMEQETASDGPNQGNGDPIPKPDGSSPELKRIRESEKNSSADAILPIATIDDGLKTSAANGESGTQFIYETPIRCLEGGLKIRIKPGLSEIRLFCTQIPMKQMESVLLAFRLTSESGETITLQPDQTAPVSLALHMRCVGSEPKPSQSEIVRDVFIGERNCLTTLAEHSVSFNYGLKLELPATDTNEQLKYEFSKSDVAGRELSPMICDMDLICISLMAYNTSAQTLFGLSNRFQLL